MTQGRVGERHSRIGGNPEHGGRVGASLHRDRAQSPALELLAELRVALDGPKYAIPGIVTEQSVKGGKASGKARLKKLTHAAVYSDRQESGDAVGVKEARSVKNGAN
jgi:hypothetical protein